MIEVLRLGHRILRDKRISTHVALVARAFGADKLYYSGQKDKELEDSVRKIVSKFGGSFSIEHIKDYVSILKNKKIVHLTMYGDDFSKYINKLNGDFILVVGGEKVPPEMYEIADYNLGVSNQPHSEVAALAVFLNHFNKFKFNDFDGEIKINPSLKGKNFL